MPLRPARQRALLVLPSAAEFDSRAHRIASTLAARGHEVTVLGRWRDGLPRDESHPSGYRILRVEVSALDGLPLGPLVARLRSRLRAFDARHDRRPSDGPGRAAGPGHRSWPRRIGAWLVANLAIPLTIRSQRRRSREVAPDVDLIHAMAYMGVPVGLDLARRQGAHVVYDARDIYLDAGNLARLRGPVRWYVARGERRWARAVDRVITVNEAYAQVMARRWGISKPLVIMNCSRRFDPPEPRERRFHDALGLDPAVRVVLYHGGFSRDRGIEPLIEAIAEVPGATLVLMGYGRLEAELRRLASERVPAGQVRFLPPIEPDALVPWIACADVVAMPIQPTTLNHRLTTPNKLFEALAAGVPVVAGDLPGMASIVQATGCGVLVDPTEPAAIARGLRAILDLPAAEAAALRARCLDAAHETYDWERQAAVLLEAYSGLTRRAW